MKNIISSLSLFIFPLLLCAQSPDYSRAKVFLYNNSINELAALGIEVDHGEHMPHRYVISDYSASELSQLREAGFEYEILIDDVVAYYKNPNRGNALEAESRVNECTSELIDSFTQYPYTTPVNYKAGSMQGYLLYEEMLAVLDEMKLKYPDLITEKKAIGDHVTLDGNRIFYLTISDNPEMEENEPKVLYNAVHHAREPNSMSQLIFYMWYLLENYETDAYVKYLVDHTQMYFIPCINPDGYIKNQIENPDGGGLWRKNTWRNDFNQVKGVDLNRNYGYFWGFDNTGSSPNENNQTFRGESAFSEVETQAVRELCLEHDFKLALNYHAFGNLLIHPWGYNDLPTEEDSIFKAFGNAMNIENDFVMGTGTETVGYIVNGDADDWMYGEQTEKSKIYSYTPEVGSSGVDGFWPKQSAIDYLNRSAMRLNLTTAHISIDKLTVVESNASEFVLDKSGELYFDSHMLGMLGGNYEFTLNADSDFIESTSSPFDKDLDFFERYKFSLGFTLKDNIPVGEILNFELLASNGFYTDTLVLKKIYLGNNLEIIPLVEEDFEEVVNWDLGQWGQTQDFFISPPFSMTDSEGSNYQNSSVNYLNYLEEIDLTDESNTTLSFWARWEIEEEWDYVQIAATVDGTNYQALCGKYTNPGSIFQVEGEPLYDGMQPEWVKEEIDLSDFAGQKIYLRFLLAADEGIAMDGFYFDDLKINKFQEKEVSSNVEHSLSREISIVPNPASLHTRIDMPGAVATMISDCIIFDNLGKRVLQIQIDGPQKEIDLSTLHSGMYYLRFRTNEGESFVRKLIKG